MGNSNTVAALPTVTIAQDKRKCVIIGAERTGKSTFVAYKDAKYEFKVNYESTIGAVFTEINIPIPQDTTKHYRIHIWDTAGAQRYDSLQPMYYRGANILLIIYDITNRTSFDRAQRYVKETKEMFTDEILVLIANKCDMQHERVVSCNEGHTFATMNSIAFVEMSCTKREDVADVFAYIAHRLSNRSYPLNYRKYDRQLVVSRVNKFCDVDVFTTS